MPSTGRATCLQTPDHSQNLHRLEIKNRFPWMKMGSSKSKITQGSIVRSESSWKVQSLISRTQDQRLENSSPKYHPKRKYIDKSSMSPRRVKSLRYYESPKSLSLMLLLKQMPRFPILQYLKSLQTKIKKSKT